MIRPETENSEPGALAAMFDVEATSEGLWTAEELGAILRHQLDAPLGCDIAATGAISEDEIRRLSDHAGGPIRSFAELLHHPESPIDLLVFVKNFAKAVREDPAAALPKSIAAVLYFASIVGASRRCGRKITRLSDEEIRTGVEWVLAQPWVDPATRALFVGERPDQDL